MLKRMVKIKYLFIFQYVFLRLERSLVSVKSTVGQNKKKPTLTESSVYNRTFRYYHHVPNESNNFYGHLLSNECENFLWPELKVTI